MKKVNRYLNTGERPPAWSGTGLSPEAIDRVVHGVEGAPDTDGELEADRAVVARRLAEIGRS